jgi:hypothetical protein
MQVPGERDLLYAVAALGAPRRFARSLNGRQQQGHENSDDGDNHQQLDKRKRVVRRPNPRLPDPHGFVLSDVRYNSGACRQRGHRHAPFNLG